MALYIDRASGSTVEHRQLRSLIADGFPRILALEYARLDVVRGKGRIHRIRRIGGRVKTDYQNAFVTRFLDRTKYSGGVRWRDQDPLDPGADEIFDGRDLSFVIAVELAEPGQKLGAALFGLRGSCLPKLDEIRIDLRLGHQPD